MKINILTLFPKMFDGFLSESIIARAIKFGAVEVNIIDIRDYCFDKHKQADDMPFGGGNGMVMKPEPLFLALENVSGKVIYTSPQGKTFNQEIAKELVKEEELTIIAGHYEGIDERVVENKVDMELSIGDFVLTGGEIPAMAISDTIIRLLPDVIKKESYENDSFYNGLLDYPHYTRPAEYKDLKVPEVLLSGNHKKIDEWRLKESLRRTYLRRKNIMRNKVYLSLVHYPVYNRNKDIVCTSVTNFDIHDISRSCGTYEIKGYRLVVPVDAQKKLTERIIGYWQDGTGGQYNKDREQAFRVTDVAESIEEVVKEIERIEGQKPLIITTSARIFDNSISYKNLSKQIFEDDKPYLLLFGTGWGLTDEVMDMSDYILEPIRANSKYNHLSVRAAVAIILDRLFGEN